MSLMLIKFLNFLSSQDINEVTAEHNDNTWYQKQIQGLQYRAATPQYWQE